MKLSTVYFTKPLRILGKPGTFEAIMLGQAEFRGYGLTLHPEGVKVTTPDRGWFLVPLVQCGQLIPLEGETLPSELVRTKTEKPAK